MIGEKEVEKRKIDDYVNKSIIRSSCLNSSYNSYSCYSDCIKEPTQSDRQVYREDRDLIVRIVSS